MDSFFRSHRSHRSGCGLAGLLFPFGQLQLKLPFQLRVDLIVVGSRRLRSQLGAEIDGIGFGRLVRIEGQQFGQLIGFGPAVE